MSSQYNPTNWAYKLNSVVEEIENSFINIFSPEKWMNERFFIYNLCRPSLLIVKATAICTRGQFRWFLDLIEISWRSILRFSKNQLKCNQKIMNYFDVFLKERIPSIGFFPFEKLGKLPLPPISRIWNIFWLYFSAAIYKMVIVK